MFWEKHVKLTMKLFVLLVICFCSLPAQAKYGGGTGGPNDPYLIFDANQMNAIGADPNDWDKCFLLCADIDLSSFTGTSFNIIGTYYDNAFTGIFDGNDHTISNFSNSRGLFGYVDDPNAEIRNLGLIDPNVDAGMGNRVGALVGLLREGSIANCYLEGGSVSGGSSVGGLVGGSDAYTTISNCYAKGSVSGDDNVGGLVGWTIGTITYCYSTGSVSGGEHVGGLVGYNEGLVTITNCYSTASVSGIRDVGGLVGENTGVINNCYSTGSVTGNSRVGGLVGDIGYGNVTDSFWDIETSGQTTSDGGTGKTTAEMQTASTFTDAGWDVMDETINGSVHIWRLCVDGTSYPQFNWQFLLGDFLCPDRVDFIDYSFFASHWAEDNCGASNDCEGTDLDKLGTVDINDLAIFIGNWLAGCPPGQAGHPNPADGATGIVVDANLSWTPGYWAALHEVYFGSDPCALPLVATQPRGQESYDPPGDLIRGTTYYWCVDEVSTHGTITGTVWCFTTIPGKAHTPSPADGAVIGGVEYEYPPGSDNWYIYTELDFVPGPTADPDPNVRRAYFSNNRDDVASRVQDANLGPPPYGSISGYETTYYVGHREIPPVTDTLVRGTTYYWCVDETDADGYTFGGDIWEFTIRGYYAFRPSPPNEAILVDPNVLLSWLSGLGVEDHDIYMGTSWDDVNNADANDTTGIYKGFRMTPNYPCSNLELATRYYWRIDEVNGRLPWFPGTIYKGDVWTFTTGSSPPP